MASTSERGQNGGFSNRKLLIKAGKISLVPAMSPTSHIDILELANLPITPEECLGLRPGQELRASGVIVRRYPTLHPRYRGGLPARDCVLIFWHSGGSFMQISRRNFYEAYRRDKAKTTG